MESLKRRTHDDIVRRWVNVRTPGHELYGKPDYDDSHIKAIDVSGDVLNSYGSHFPLVEAIRDRRGRTHRWLLNGDVWRGSSGFGVATSSQQAQVRNLVKATGLPHVTVPFSVLDEAGIIHSTVRPLDVSEDWTETITHVEHTRPAHSVWNYETATVPGTAGYVHKVTGEWLDGYQEMDQRTRVEVGPWARTEGESWEEWYARKRAAEDRWQEVPRVEKNTGRRTLRLSSDSYREWELVDVDGELTYQRDTYRHWLGESLIEGTVAYQSLIKCRRCKGEGVHDGDVTYRRQIVEGPADRWGGPVFGMIPIPSCDECGGQRRYSVRRTRKAKFLSGFDQNESRPSYFFCELPKMSETTITAAYEALKPTTVRLAEQMGRDVKRQGDIFAVPVLNLTKRDLTKSGATFERGAHILGTNHKVTEVAHLSDGRVLARGTITHAPDFRRPDHARVTIGKAWHLIVKNTVPVASNR